MSAVQTVKEHLRGYEKGLADAVTTPRSKEVQMATVQAKLQGYSEVRGPADSAEPFVTLHSSLLWSMPAGLPPLQLEGCSGGLSQDLHDVVNPDCTACGVLHVISSAQAADVCPGQITGQAEGLWQRGWEEPPAAMMRLLALLLQGLEAGEAEAKASIKAVHAEKAELEGHLSALEDKIEALETENANLESMKV